MNAPATSRADGLPGSGPGRLVAAVMVPLAVVGAAYGSWWLSDRLLYVGPLDRAAFGWLVVIPVWVLAPVAASLAWSRLEPSTERVAAVAVGAAVATVAAFLFWSAVASPSCESGPIRQPADWVVPSIVLGGVIGGGQSLSGLLGARFLRRGRPGVAILVASGSEVLMVALAIAVAGAILIGPACQRTGV